MCFSNSALSGAHHSPKHKHDKIKNKKTGKKRGKGKREIKEKMRGKGREGRRKYKYPTRNQ